MACDSNTAPPPKRRNTFQSEEIHSRYLSCSNIHHVLLFLRIIAGILASASGITRAGGYNSRGFCSAGHRFRSCHRCYAGYVSSSENGPVMDIRLGEYHFAVASVVCVSLLGHEQPFRVGARRQFPRSDFVPRPAAHREYGVALRRAGNGRPRPRRSAGPGGFYESGCGA
jgi:hypothetical protein